MEAKEIRHIITDVDGVILDRMPIYGEAYCLILMNYFSFKKESLLDLYFSTAGTPIANQFILALENHKITYNNEFIKRLVEEFFNEAGRHIPELFPFATELISEIKKNGFSLCATSGSQTDELQKIFSQFGLNYDYVLGSDKTPKSKKHIELFAEYLRVDFSQYCKESIYLGDGPTDMRIAKECGIMAVGITTTVSRKKLLYAGADVIISELQDFLNILNKKGGKNCKSYFVS